MHADESGYPSTLTTIEPDYVGISQRKAGMGVFSQCGGDNVEYSASSGAKMGVSRPICWPGCSEIGCAHFVVGRELRGLGEDLLS